MSEPTTILPAPPRTSLSDAFKGARTRSAQHRVCRFCGKLAKPGLRTCGDCGIGYQVAHNLRAPLTVEVQ